MKKLVTLHPLSGSRDRRMKASLQLTFFIILQCRILRPGHSTAHSQYMSPHAHPEAYFPHVLHSIKVTTDRKHHRPKIWWNLFPYCVLTTCFNLQPGLILSVGWSVLDVNLTESRIEKLECVPCLWGIILSSPFAMGRSTHSGQHHSLGRRFWTI